MRIQQSVLKALLLLMVIALVIVPSGCRPESVVADLPSRQGVSQPTSSTPEVNSPLPTPTPQPTSPVPTMTPWTPPTPQAQTPTPLPLPPVATSPAGRVFFTAFFAPGTTPSEPKLFYAPFDEQGQLSGAVSRWTPSIDVRVDIGRLSASPDGDYLASVYDTEGGDVAQIIDLTAGEPTTFVSAGEFFGWHPNGYQFLFDQEIESDPGLWLVDARTGQHQLLAQPAAINVSGAAISPDGQALAYGVSDAGIQQIWMANADGSEPRLMLESNSTSIVYSWSPDGRYLLYTGEPTQVVGKGTPVPPAPPLWLMDRAGQNRRPLNLPWETFGFILKPVWSPTGRYVAGIGRTGEIIACWHKGAGPPDPLCLFQNAGVYVEDVETGEVQLIAHNAADFMWSPDGSLLAIARMDEKGQVDIWVIGIDGSNLQRVTDTAEVDRYPVWIPR